MIYIACVFIGLVIGYMLRARSDVNDLAEELKLLKLEQTWLNIQLKKAGVIAVKKGGE